MVRIDMSEYMEKYAVSRLDRRAARLRRLRGGRPADRGRPAPPVPGRPARRDREGPPGRLQRPAPGARRRPADRRPGAHGRLQEHRRHHDQQRRQRRDRGRAARGRGDAAYEAMKREVTDALARPLPAGVPQPGRRGHRLPRPDRGRPRRGSSTCWSPTWPKRLADQDLGLELTRRGEGADRPRGDGSGLRGPAAQADDPAARREPAGPGARRRRVQAGRPDRRRRGPAPGTLVFSTAEPRSYGDRGARRDARSRSSRARPAATGSSGIGRRDVRRCDLPPTRAQARTTASSSTSDGCGRCGSTTRPDRLARPAGRRCRRRPSVLMPVVVGETGQATPRPGVRPPGPAGAARPAVLVLLYPDADRVGPGRPDRARRPVTAITAARSASPAGRPSPTTSTSRPRPCARRPRRSGSMPTPRASGSSGSSKSFWIPVSDFAVTPVVAVADATARA